TSNLLYTQINKVFCMISYFYLVLVPFTPNAMTETLAIQPNSHYKCNRLQNKYKRLNILILQQC
ncbi:hypothetical protein, partial [Priestia megaterium]